MAAAGSAVGLGNLWKFPYITFDNQGGSFVLVYVVCIAVVGLPIMVAKGGTPLNWFDSFDYLASNWLLPLGGLAIAVFAGWTLTRSESEEEYGAGAPAGRGDYDLWRVLTRYVSPILVATVLLYKVGVFG